MQFIIDYGPFAAVAALALLQLLAPARALPEVRAWRVKGVIFFVLYLTIATLVPMSVDSWLGQFQVFDLTHLGLGSGTLVAIVAVQVVSYWWHRALHRVPFLWRWFHQMHHSAERIDVFGAFYSHPFDVAAFTVMGSIALVLLVGVNPEAAALANVIVFAVVVLGHTNIRTPRWLGYLVQRPENHALHHQRGLHAHNYADFSLIDIVFGTFQNPEKWEGEAGFYDGASERVGDLLLGRDITQVSPIEPDAWRGGQASIEHP